MPSVNDVVLGRATWAVKHGDCLDVLRRLRPGCVDAVVTDPPYGINWRGGNGRARPIANDDRPFIWWLRDAWRATRDGGALVCFCRWDVQEAFRFGIEIAGWTIKSQVIWDRLHHGMGDTTSTFSPRHDVAWFATKGRFSFPGRRPPSVLRAARPHSADLHPTRKPDELMVELVEAVSRPGDLVVDPFAGSGSTGVAAARLARRFIGVELDARYASIARLRVRQAASRAIP